MAVIRVLLIEDDPSYARLIERMLALSPIGFNVTVAGTLMMALSSLAEGRFNLILTDLNLPDIKGLGTIEAVRSAEPALPIVVLTGREDADLEEQAILCGAQCWLNKSEIDTQNLLEAMHQAVRISRRRAPLIKGQQVERLLTELEESLIVVRDALGLLDIQRRDTQHEDAVHTIRSHIGKMQEKISSHRCLGQ